VIKQDIKTTMSEDTKQYLNNHSHDQDLYIWWLIVIILIIVIFLIIISEYNDHDCIPGKNCKHRCKEAHDKDNIDVHIDKIKDMVRSNYDIVTWRQALLIAIILPPIIIFYLKNRWPSLLEWFIIGILVFLGVYLSYSWIWAHFFHPNGMAIENNLEKLRAKAYYTYQNSKSQYTYY